MRKKLLWVGDAGVPSGFAKATHNILHYVMREYDVTVLGINYRGDPHAYPYDIFAAAPGGDFLGVGRLIWMCDAVKPDVVVIQNDPWLLPLYLKKLKSIKEYAKIPVVAACAVDGKGLEFKPMNGFDLAIFWTQFGLDESRAGGYEGAACVIPLGVDTKVFHPMDKKEAKNKRLPTLVDNFIVGNVNRNQSRKRLDLTIKCFCEWVKDTRNHDAQLYLHVAPTGDTGVDVVRLMRYYGLLDRLALVQPDTWYGITEEEMCLTYNCFDLQVTTSIGEGFGLTTFEGAACEVAQILPKHSALLEYFEGAAWLVDCSSTMVLDPNSAIGGVIDEHKFMSALDAMYKNPRYIENNGQAARERAAQTRFTWEHVGQMYLDALKGVFERKEEVVGA
jgi:glycosyltransferase involved in cell wall biosynthesis